MARYINPYTDFGFKKLFGEEGNKNLLIDFLNQLLPARHQIANLAFQNVEQLPDTQEERKAFFDIHCKSTTGERFIVEMRAEDYEKSRLNYMGFKQATDTAERDGLQKGIEKGKLEVAKRMKEKGIAYLEIAELTGISTAIIEQL